MDSPKPFPILRLPFLAIEDVFKAMHPYEIFIFSVISKRTKRISKQMSFYPRYAICLCIDETLGIEIHGTNNVKLCLYLRTMEENTVEGEGSSYYNLRRILKYSTDPVEEWKLLCKHVLEIFKKQSIDNLSMTMDVFVDQNVSIIDFLKTNVQSVDICNLDQSEEKNDVDEHAAYLLNNLKVNNELNFLLRIKNVNFNGKFPKNQKELYIENGDWIGYEKLLEIDSVQVILVTNRISNKDWNLFFKKWIAMETQLNLELMYFEIKSLEEFRSLVLHDIPHEVVDGGVKRVLKTYRDVTREISGGVDIKRIDGKTATFFLLYDYCSMSVH
ncbi:hypothetical protein GCK72_015443 [Caenorhabditis remanei]|uniref:F-box domain-containing protein n=1 Tax=Caenorhabditis remanei TaxID=31234 RepID=A0A6A5GX43_CAERE|nr:hypothetical protein GCK72_015443 [Caenorhabditis remanei]KAF1758983.1 hypothetical protein GCK72_015443 [Caenorhabditis remanei]